jgi:hypothetical protein
MTIEAIVMAIDHRLFSIRVVVTTANVTEVDLALSDASQDLLLLEALYIFQ